MAKDPKTELQEWLQGHKMKLPVYRVAGTLGAAHKQTFDVECEVPELGLRERGIGGRDAALATELAYGTLRGLGTYDAIIEVCSDRAPDPEVRDALRLGAHQLLKMRVPPHAAVGTTVDLVRLRVGPGAAKFANAVARKIASRSLEEWVPIVAPDAGDDPAGHLAVAHRYTGGSSARSATRSAPPRTRPPTCSTPTTRGRW